MIIGCLTIKEVAEKWDVTPKRVRVLCETVRITSGEYKDWRKKESSLDKEKTD